MPSNCEQNNYILYLNSSFSYYELFHSQKDNGKRIDIMWVVCGIVRLGNYSMFYCGIINCTESKLFEEGTQGMTSMVSTLSV